MRMQARTSLTRLLLLCDAHPTLLEPQGIVDACSKVFRQYSKDSRVAKDWDKLLVQASAHAAQRGGGVRHNLHVFASSREGV